MVAQLPALTMIPTTSVCASELISALADGQLLEDELVDVWELLEHREEAAADWASFHLIGDLLRTPDGTSSQLAVRSDSASFVNRFNSKLQAERRPDPVALECSLRSRPVGAVTMPLIEPRFHEKDVAANDSVFRWKLLAGFATVAAISVFTWTATGSMGLSTESQLAQRPDTNKVLVESPQGLLVRDARLNELLAAHKQLGSTSALQAPSGFLQSAAFEFPQGSDR